MMMLIFLLCLWSCVAFASYFNKHQTQIYHKVLSEHVTKWLLWCGYGLSFLACVVAIYALKPSIGISYWFGIFTITAVVVIWTMTYQAQRFFKIIYAVSLSILVGGICPYIFDLFA